jgi:putative membrane protein
MGKAIAAIANVARGVLIGLAEIVPGVSGGTIALIVGVYRALISSAAHVVGGVFALARRKVSESRAEFSGVSFAVVLPVLVGMVGGIFAGAALLEPVLENYPLHTRAVFAGLILASLWVPFRMVGAWDGKTVVLAGGAAVVTFFLTGIPAVSAVSPSLWAVAPAAALAVCALVLPGVSGSFILVTLGMYQPTLQAVNDLNFAYLGVFVAGAAIGLALFVRVLQHLLSNFHRVTLAIMTGLMAGSLRALWPWQGEGRELLGVGEDALSVAIAVVSGVAVVVVLLVAEKVWTPRVNLV